MADVGAQMIKVNGVTSLVTGDQTQMELCSVPFWDQLSLEFSSITWKQKLEV